jgi:hypothetical protein
MVKKFGVYCLHDQRPEVEEVRTSESPINFYQTTKHPRRQSFHTSRSENLKFHPCMHETQSFFARETEIYELAS